MLANQRISEAPEDASAYATAGLSQNELAYMQLKNRLTTLFYKPGEYLNTAALMNNLQLGRTPLNHALHRLANEGLVQIIPRKGVMVSPLSIDDALDMIDVRLVNEVLCAQLASKRITSAEISELRSISKLFDTAVEERNVAVMMNADRQFHEAIANASRNNILIEVLRVLHARSQRFWAISLSSAGHTTEVRAEHQAIINSLENSDAEAAKAAIQHHILSFRQALLNKR